MSLSPIGNARRGGAVLVVHRTLTTWQAAMAWDSALPGGHMTYQQAMEQLEAGQTMSRWAWPPDKRLFGMDEAITATGNLDLGAKTETWEPWEATPEDKAATDWAVFDPRDGWHAELEPIRDGVGRRILGLLLSLFGLRLRTYWR